MLSLILFAWYNQVDSFWNDVYREMTVNLLHPVVLVDYTREAYLHPAEEVRITFDMQLRSGLNSIDIFITKQSFKAIV